MDNYNTSKNYELLWYLLQQNIRIISINPLQIISWKIDNKNKFIKYCEETNVEFIIPTNWFTFDEQKPETDTYIFFMRKNFYIDYGYVNLDKTIISKDGIIVNKSIVYWIYRRQTPNKTNY